MFFRLICAAFFPVLLTLASAEETPADKSRFTLFSPTPAALLREFDSARPDHTDSSHTVDAGHVQLEMDIVAYVRDRHNSDRSFVRTEDWAFANANFRVGITNWADVEFVIPFFQGHREKDTSTGDGLRQRGIGDFTAVLKMNFWGNDGGKTSGGLEFFVKMPTATHHLGNGQVEGGGLLLFGTALPGDFDLGINTGVAAVANEPGSRHHAEFINSASVSHKVFGPLSAYAEIWSDTSAQAHTPVIVTADFGLLLLVGKNVQFDAGVNLGLTRAAPDIQTVLGVSVRF